MTSRTILAHILHPFRVLRVLYLWWSLRRQGYKRDWKLLYRLSCLSRSERQQLYKFLILCNEMDKPGRKKEK